MMHIRNCEKQPFCMYKSAKYRNNAPFLINKYHTRSAFFAF